MADKQKFEEVSAGVVQTVTTTTATPANADKTSAPVDNDAKGNQPPVRTNRPDVPIAQVLAAGAGKHEPTDDPNIGADGRFYADKEMAEESRLGFGRDPKLAESPKPAESGRNPRPAETGK